MQRQDDVSKFLTSVGLPSEWHVSPMPAIGGPVEIYNIFDAFIAITGDIDPKPNLIHITDLLEKGKLACIRCLKEYSENPPNRTMEKAKAVPKHIGSAISWFFPKKSNVRRLVGLLLQRSSFSFCAICWGFILRKQGS